MIPISLNAAVQEQLESWSARDATEALVWIGFAEAFIQSLSSSCRLVAASHEGFCETLRRVGSCSRRAAALIADGRLDLRVDRLRMQIEDLGKWTSPIVTDSECTGCVDLIPAGERLSASCLLGGSRRLIGLLGAGFHHLERRGAGDMEARLEESLTQLGAASQHAAIVDPYAWKAFAPENGNRWVAARRSLKFVVDALLAASANQIHRIELVTVMPDWDPREEWRPDRRFREQVADAFFSLARSANRGQKDLEAWVTWHLRDEVTREVRRRFEDRLHARFVMTEVGGFGFDPGVDAIFRGVKGSRKTVLSERLAVRLIRAEEMEMVARARRYQSGKDHVVDSPTPLR